MYLIEVDPGSMSILLPHKYFVDAKDPNEAYDMFWEKCIHDPENSLMFDRLFVYGDDGFIFTREHFQLDPCYWGKKDRRIYYERRIKDTDPPPGSISIILTRVPTQIKAGYKQI